MGEPLCSHCWLFGKYFKDYLLCFEGASYGEHIFLLGGCVPGDFKVTLVSLNAAVPFLVRLVAHYETSSLTQYVGLPRSFKVIHDRLVFDHKTESTNYVLR